MEELNVSMTYGEALYNAAKDLGKEKELLEEAKAVKEILKNEESFLMLINDPTITASEKKKIITNVFGGKISQELLNFFFVLIDKRRISHFIKMVDVFEKLVNTQEGFATGVVYSARELSKEKLAKIEEETGKLIREKVKLTQEIDTSLIGGIKILVNGKIIDASIRNRLQDISGQLIH